ncbi:hypothetical protein [Raoultibacter timonensis]|uniref:hypothetical protein n=1 Tax=Raoultibacter timonensis TaxID=1907662 RepID=UPI000C829D3B|nr:hypothetical protein [Raoultibacter timonensis]
MSGKFILVKERTKYRFNLVDDQGDVLFKGAIASTKDMAQRKVDLMKSWGDDLVYHLQPMAGPHGGYTIRGEEHTSREGEQGRIGDAAPLGFSAVFETEDEMERVRKEIVSAAKGAVVEDQTEE